MTIVAVDEIKIPHSNMLRVKFRNRQVEFTWNYVGWCEARDLLRTLKIGWRTEQLTNKNQLLNRDVWVFVTRQSRWKMKQGQWSCPEYQPKTSIFGGILMYAPPDRVGWPDNWIDWIGKKGEDVDLEYICLLAGKNEDGSDTDWTKFLKKQRSVA